MHRKKFKYRFLAFLILAIVTELILWLLTWGLLSIFGIFSAPIAGNHLVFIHPKLGYFHIIGLIILLGSYFWYMRKRNKMVAYFPSSVKFNTLLFPVSTQRLWIRYFLLRIALFLAVFALMQPAFGTKKVKGVTTGVELIFAVDVSNSMNTKDTEAKEARLTIAKRVMKQIVEKGNTSSIGMVVFAGNAFTQLPLTPNNQAVKMYINQLNTSFVSNQGTNIAAAFEEAAHLFSKKQNKKILILITDGEDHAGGLSSAITTLEKQNVKVLILGIGSKKGGLIPASKINGSSWLRNKDGHIVTSKINRKMLQMIQQKTGGTLLISDSPFPNISDFLTDINNLSDNNIVNLEFEVKENRYQWPLGGAILMIFIVLTIGAFPRETREI